MSLSVEQLFLRLGSFWGLFGELFLRLGVVWGIEAEGGDFCGFGQW